jgi:RNA polymerase sigma-70 factor (ECF subfamily)
VLTTVMKLTVDEASTLVRDHQREVWRYLVALGCSPVEAEDLTQETFLYLFRSDFELRGAPQTRSFLRKTAQHLLIDSRRRHTTVDLDAVDYAWEPEVGDDGGDERVRLLKDCMAKLQGRARDAVMLKYGRGLSHADCGEQLGTNEEAAKSLVRRAREKLRECMESGLKAGLRND